MATFILHGGATGVRSENNDKFFQEIAAADGETVRVLIIPFAREREQWPELLQKIKERFYFQSRDKATECSLASEDPAELAEQLRTSNVVYLAGGQTERLQARLEKIVGFKELISGKIVAGSSAGALVLAKYYYDNDTDKIAAGLGLLPIKLITHYVPELETKFMQLDLFQEKLQTYALAETEFLVLQS